MHHLHYVQAKKKRWYAVRLNNTTDAGFAKLFYRFIGDELTTARVMLLRYYALIVKSLYAIQQATAYASKESRISWTALRLAATYTKPV